VGLGLADEGGKRPEVVAGALGGDAPRVEEHAGREDGHVAARDQEQLRALRVSLRSRLGFGVIGFGFEGVDFGLWGWFWVSLDWIGWVEWILSNRVDRTTNLGTKHTSRTRWTAWREAWVVEEAHHWVGKRRPRSYVSAKAEGKASRCMV
jgi:hypothetical protein